MLPRGSESTAAEPALHVCVSLGDASNSHLNVHNWRWVSATDAPILDGDKRGYCEWDLDSRRCVIQSSSRVRLSPRRGARAAVSKGWPMRSVVAAICNIWPSPLHRSEKSGRRAHEADWHVRHASLSAERVFV